MSLCRAPHDGVACVQSTQVCTAPCVGGMWAKKVLSKGREAFRLKALENYCGGKAFIRT